MNTKKCIFFPRFLVTLTAMLALTLCMAGQADAAYSWNGEAETGLVKFWEKNEDGHGVYHLFFFVSLDLTTSSISETF